MRIRFAARCVPLVLGVALIAGCASSGGHSARTSAPAVMMGQSANRALPPTVTNARLVGTDGKSFNLSTLRGKIVVVSDMMTLCQETCPLDTANVVAAARAAEKAGLGNKIEFVSVTIDPQRDTVRQLAAYRRLYRPAPADWTLATGSSAALKTFWNQLGVIVQRVPEGTPPERNWRTNQPLTYDLNHSDELFFLSPNGRERYMLEGTPHVASGAPIPARIRKFMDADGFRHLRHPHKSAWTLPQELEVISWLAGKQISA